jgi:hypothetical protein
VRAAAVDRAILQLGAAPEVKIGEKLDPQSKDVRDKSAPLDPNTPSALSPASRSAGNNSSLTLASIDLVQGNLSADVPNIVPTTRLVGTGVDGLTQQLLSALPSTVQTVTAIATAQPEHIVRVIRETVIVRTVTKSSKAAANNVGQVINGVARNGNLVQKGTNTLRSSAAAAGATVIKGGLGPQTFGSGPSGGSLGGFGTGGTVGGASGGFGGVGGAAGGAIGGLGGAGGSLGGGLGGTLGGTVSGALGGAGNAVSGIGGGH